MPARNGRGVALLAGSALCAGVLATAPGLAQTAPVAVASAGKPAVVEEIVVTAERRNSTVQKTPVSMAAISGAELQQRGLTSVTDVSHEVAGISIRSAGPGQTEYESRGLASNGGASPTVGFYLNDTPLSPPANGQTGKVVIDPSLYDVSRIEVLRGPQGQLYGSGSMGGTIRIITNQPVMNEYTGSVEGIGSGTVGGGLNGTGNAMVNIPIVNDKLAIRIVGTDTFRSGFIDRLVLDPFPLGPTGRGNVLAAPVVNRKNGVNDERLDSIRAQILFKPTDWLTFNGLVLHQGLSQGGYDEFEVPPGAKHLAVYQAFNQDEPIYDRINIFALTGTADLDYAELTSSSGYWVREQKQRQDASENEYYDFGYKPLIPQLYAETDNTSQFTQELRLASKDTEGDRLKWVLGGFYSDLHALWQQFGGDAADGAVNNQSIAVGDGPDPQGIIFRSHNPYRLKQYASFGSVTYDVTDKLKITAGVRWDKYISKQLNSEWGYGLPTVTQPAHGLPTKGTGHAKTPRVNVSYQFTPDLMVYTTVAQGYRTGGANQYVPASLCGVNPQSVISYKPDSVWNYEVGEKGRFLDGRLTINADFYYIRWSQIQQLALLSCGYEYYANSGNGHTFGPELEAKFKLTPEWTIAGEGSYTDAAITQPSTALASYDIKNALPGLLPDCKSIENCTLPILNVPAYSGSLSLIYTHPLEGDRVLTARLTDVYVGPATDESYTPIIHLPPYNVVNLRAGVTQGKWTGAFFVDNLTNKHATLTANNTSFQWNTPGYYRASTNQPLTIGIDASYHF